MPKYKIHQLSGYPIIKQTYNLVDAAWWRWMPGVTFTIKWPVGRAVLDEMPDGSTTSTESADPNDHYRPWLEKNVGKQGWDWRWGLKDNNAADNRLTIKFRAKHAKWATLAALKWS